MPPPPMPSERAALLEALRAIMKTRKVTATALAKELGVSAQTLKRLFNGTGDCTLERLVAICGCLGIGFFDLVALAKEPREKFFELTWEQEELLAAQPHVHEFFYRLRDDETPDQIAAANNLSPRAVQRYLKALDELGLVERLGGTKCRLKVEGAHNFIKDGPLNRRYTRRDMDRMFDWLEVPENRNDMTLFTSTGTSVAPATARELVQELREVAARYRRRAQRDRTVLSDKESLSIRWLLTVATGMPKQKVDRIIEI